MAESMSSHDDEASQLTQACKKRMIDNVKLLMKTDEEGKLVKSLHIMLLTNQNKDDGKTKRKDK